MAAWLVFSGRNELIDSALLSWEAGLFVTEEALDIDLRRERGETAETEGVSAIKGLGLSRSWVIRLEADRAVPAIH